MAGALQSLIKGVTQMEDPEAQRRALARLKMLISDDPEGLPAVPTFVRDVSEALARERDTVPTPPEDTNRNTNAYIDKEGIPHLFIGGDGVQANVVDDPALATAPIVQQPVAQVTSQQVAPQEATRAPVLPPVAEKEPTQGIPTLLREPAYDTEAPPDRYNINMARDDNVSDERSFHYLRDNPHLSPIDIGNFDWQRALDDGRSWADISYFAATGENSPNPEALRTASRATHVAAAGIAGLPSDFAGWVAETATSPTSKWPDMMKAFGEAHGGIPLPPDTMSGLEELKARNRFIVPEEGMPGGSQAIRRAMREHAENIGMAPDTFTYPNIQALAKEDRPVAIGTETLMEGAFMGPLSGVIGGVRKFGAGQAALEGLGITGSAVGATAAEILDPNDPMSRVIGTVGGGLVHPVSLLTRVLATKGPDAWNAIKSILPGFNKGVGGVGEAQAAKYLQQTLIDLGYSPKEIAKLYEESSVSLAQAGVKDTVTMGQALNDSLLIAVEKKIASSSPLTQSRLVANEAATRAQLSKQAEALEGTGDPQALRAAALLRRGLHEEQIAARLENAKAQMDMVQENAMVKGPNVSMQTSVRTRAILESALDDVNDAQKRLWERIDKKAVAPVDGTIASYQNVMDQILSTDKSLDNTEIGRFISLKLKPPKASKLLGADGKPLPGKPPTQTMGEAQEIRSHALERSKTARTGANPDLKLAARWTMISDGVLKDMQLVDAVGVDAARAYSRQLNKTFRETFVGKAMGQVASGADAVSPELLLIEAWSPGKEKAFLRFEELTNATRMGANAPTVGAGGGVDLTNVNNIVEQQARFLRRAASETTEGGKVDPNRLRRFVHENEALLNRFPGIKKDLESSASAQDVFKQVEDWSKSATEIVRTQTVFGRLLNAGREGVPGFVRGALRGADPQRDYQALVATARRHPDPKKRRDALAGLKNATIEQARREATRPDGTVDFAKYSAEMLGTTRKGSKSVLDLMKRQKVVSPDEAKRLEQIIETGANYEKALASGISVDKVIEDPNALSDLLIRTLGARVATSNPIVKGAGTSLIAAQAGSKFLRKFFYKLPSKRAMDVLNQAVLDPELMKVLLLKPTTAKEARNVERRIRAYMLAAGVPLLSEDEE